MSGGLCGSNDGGYRRLWHVRRARDRNRLAADAFRIWTGASRWAPALRGTKSDGLCDGGPHGNRSQPLSTSSRLRCAMIPLNDAETLSRLFHLNSEPWSNAEAYREAQDYEVDYKQLPGSRRINLPEPEDSALLKLLRTRTSCREYRLARLPLGAFSTILKCAYG